MSSRKREEDFEVQSRADSDTLTELFHDQIRGSHDAFLLESRDLTVEHVNRLSTEPAGRARGDDRYNGNGVRTPHNDGEDLLALDSDDAENWLVASPGPSTSNSTAVSSPRADAGDRASKRPWTQTNATSAGAKGGWQAGAPPSKKLPSSDGRSASKKWSPRTDAGARDPNFKTKRSLRTGTSMAGGRVRNSDLSRPGTPGTPDANANPDSRIPKPSSSYSSPLRDSTSPSRIPRPPTPGTPTSTFQAGQLPGEVQETSAATDSVAQGGRKGSWAASTPGASPKVTRSGSGTGSGLRKSKDYGAKFNEMWGSGNLSSTANKMTKHVPSSWRDDSQAVAVRPSRSVEPAVQRQDLEPSMQSMNSHPLNDILTSDGSETMSPSHAAAPSTVAEHEAANPALLSTGEAFVVPTAAESAALQQQETENGHASGADNTSGAENNTATSESWPPSVEHAEGRRESGGGNQILGQRQEDEQDIYTPATKRKGAAPTALELLHRDGSGKANSGAFTKAFSRKRSSSNHSSTPTAGRASRTPTSSKDFGSKPDTGTPLSQPDSESPGVSVIGPLRVAQANWPQNASERPDEGLGAGVADGRASLTAAAAAEKGAAAEPEIPQTPGAIAATTGVGSKRFAPAPSQADSRAKSSCCGCSIM